MLRRDVFAQLIVAKRIATIAGTIEPAGELHTDPQPYSIPEPISHVDGTSVTAPNVGTVHIDSDCIADNPCSTAAQRAAHRHRDNPRGTHRPDDIISGSVGDPRDSHRPCNLASAMDLYR